jgi:tetratricopeptide (TPR) repeat protein
MFAIGEGVEKDMTEATYWFQQAAEQGNAEAQFSLGNIYTEGLGTAKNEVEAVRWYRKAAEQGHVKSQAIVGRMPAKGQVDAKEDEKAGQTSSDLHARAAKCDDFEDCFNVMLLSANPRNSESINLAAARIAEFQQKPQRGNRKLARKLNTQGLAEFKKDNFTEAVNLWSQASSEDPADVEVLTNYGLALYKANRAQDARQVLRSSLTINPRRTNTWVPMAEVLFEIGDSDSAFASLLLAYEFSGDQGKTRSFFDGRAISSERVAPLYLRALKKINESQWASPSEESSAAVSSAEIAASTEK